MASMLQTVDPILVPVAAAVTDVGKRREHNEDQVLLADEVRVYGVADGMGGHQAGDVASSIAAASIEEFFWSDSAEDEAFLRGFEGDSDAAKRVVAALHFANDQVFEKSGTSANQGGMGSTAVVIHVDTDEGQVHIGHVGDSRCYRIRDGSIELLTEDHSMINEALRLNPNLSEDILAQLPTNVVTRALGTKESVRPEIRSEPLVHGDMYLLCSDGLSGEVSDDLMLETIQIFGEDLQEGCETLIALANDAGGRDNVSAVLVRIEDFENVASESEPTHNLVVLDGDDGETVEEEAEDVRSTQRDFRYPTAPLDGKTTMRDGDSGPGDPGEAALAPHDDEEHDAYDDDDDEGEDDDAVDLDAFPLSADAAELKPESIDEFLEREDALESDVGVDVEVEVESPPPTPPRPSRPRRDSASSFPTVLDDAIAYAKHTHLEPGDDSVSVMPVYAVGAGSEPPPEPKPIRCPSCGHRLTEAERFCGMCGTDLHADRDEDLAHCDACGHVILAGTAFCVECGVLHGY
ncbi:MAG: protein phosphatase 2C domain-containing protein [Myxococcota bacterium]